MFIVEEDHNIGLSDWTSGPSTERCFGLLNRAFALEDDLAFDACFKLVQVILYEI